MIYQLTLAFEAIAFLIFSIGVIPLPIKSDNGIAKLPYLNRSICILISSIIFWFMALSTVSYQYTYCYVNQTISNFATNTTTSTATCAAYSLQSLDLSYLNYGMGIITIVLFILFSVLALSQEKESKYND